MQHEKYRYIPNKITNHGGFPWLIPHNSFSPSLDITRFLKKKEKRKKVETSGLMWGKNSFSV